MKNRTCIATGNALKHTGFGYTLAVIGGKYKMTILYLLAEHQVLRHNELHRRIETISFKSLSVMLKELIADEMINRTEYSQVPPKVEYSLTERGKTLIPVLNTLCDWGEQQQAMEIED